MTEAEKARMRLSIVDAKKKLDRGLITDPEAVSILHRMIHYYEAKLKEGEDE
jgi:hypothetical protein